jgi:flagellar secretion chaperone FliS
MSGIQSPANRYREVAVKTANPLQLVVMLYDAAIYSIQEAREQIARKDIAGRSRSINRCISIISELQSCLNHQAGGEIASSLDRLYDYMKRRIFRANVDQSVQPLAEIEVLLESLRSAWVQLGTQTQGAAEQTAKQELPSRGAPRSSAPSTMQPKSLNISI